MYLIEYLRRAHQILVRPIFRPLNASLENANYVAGVVIKHAVGIIYRYISLPNEYSARD